MAAYKIENGDINNRLWENGGVCILGNKRNKLINRIDIVSNNFGESFYGTVQYLGDEPKEFRARLDKDNMYRAEIREEGSSSSWISDGIWVIGNRSNERCTKLNISSDNEKILSGVIKYGTKDEVEMKGELISSYLVENHWGKETASWHFGGVWILSESDKKVKFMDISSNDSGESFYGNVQYLDQDKASFKAKRIYGNNYEVYTKSIYGNESWKRRQDMIIGSRDNQRVVKLTFDSNDDGNNIYGTMAYESEGPIKFRAALINY